ncbi:hypothetical protein [Algoriphagus namhaensis]
MDQADLVVFIYEVLVVVHILEKVVANLWKLREGRGSWVRIIVMGPMHQVIAAPVVKLNSFGFALDVKAKPNLALDEK